MRNFKFKQEQLIDGDIDFQKYQLLISGRYTEKRFKLLESYCAEKTVRIPVYSDYDCTGQLCGVSYSVEYAQNSYKITATYSYDY